MVFDFKVVTLNAFFCNQFFSFVLKINFNYFLSYFANLEFV